MKLNLLLKLKSWQLFAISVLLLISSFLLFGFGPHAVKFGLIIWFAYNHLYLSSIGFALKGKIPSDIHLSFKFFTLAIILNTILFALFIWLALGPNRIIENGFFLLVCVLVVGLVGLYVILFALRTVLVAENGRDVHYGDVFMEYLKTSFSPMSFFAYQKRVQSLL